MGSFPYPFNSIPSDLTQAASWLQANFQDAADTAYVDAEIAAASLATAAGVQANLDAHIADSTDAHDASAISVVDTGGYYSSADVEGSLQEVGADVDAVASGLAAHLADTTDAHDASAISILDAAGDFTATEVEGALAELQSDAEADAAALAAHIADTTDAHDASAISYAGGTGMSATDVESALDELATEKANAADLAVTQAEVDAVEVDLAAHEAETSTAHGGFYTQTQSNARFVNIDGDTMTGDLAVVEGTSAAVLSADSIQFGSGTETAGGEWGLDLYGTGLWGGAEVDSLDVGFERLTPGVLSITSGDELDMTPGTLRVDTQAPLDNSTKSASTAYVDAAVTAGAALTITESGIIIPSGVTTVQHALRNVEAYVQNLEESFEQHHHDERYRGRAMQVSKAAAQTIGHASPTKLAFDTLNTSTEGNDTSYLQWDSSNNRIIVNRPCVVRVAATHMFAATALGGIRTMEIYRNGASARFGLIPIDTSALTSQAGTITSLFTVATAGTYFELFVYQNTGGNLNTGSGEYVQLSVEIVSA